MEIAAEVLEFSLKVLVAGGLVLVLLLLAFGLLDRMRRRKTSGTDGDLVVKPLNKKLEATANGIRIVVLGRRAAKRFLKERKKEAKHGQQAERPKAYVLDFKGDVTASDVSSLREEITAILSVVGKEDQVIVRLESGGGLMPAYGLAASQLGRIKSRGIPLTVCVDKIAASGGYMMASVADRIVAAPFAIVGSIGVVAMLPNFHRFLKNHDIDYEELTAGEFKRTVTVLGEITEKGRAKFMEELEDAHKMFKEFVSANRPELDVDLVATGEHWYGSRALARKLVDHLATSDDILVDLARDNDVYEVVFSVPQPVHERILGLFGLGRRSASFAGTDIVV